MSLFNTLDFWSTRCGEDDSFGFDSLITSDLIDSGRDMLIVGSFRGLLRIYQISENESDKLAFKPSDLLLETQLSSSIIQIVVGKLISGSRSLHIGVAFPTKIGVYSFSSTPGSTEHGNQFDLKMIYEHPMLHINYQLIIGPFGGVKGRDFLCAVAVDGTLTFFEQETSVFQTQLPTFLLPSPVVYVAENDIFVTLSANWCIEAYKYQDIVNTAKKKISSSWSYNLGENLAGIQTVKHHLHKETFIVALSERNVTCLGAGGSLKFSKRLSYTPLCFHIYLNESNNNLMILIVSDQGTLFIYKQTTLLWSSKLPIVPICISRAKTVVSGTLVLLSDQGELKCCYLGTKPSLFVAPPIENPITAYKNANAKLENLQNEIKNFRKNNSDSLSLAVAEQELSVVLKVCAYEQLLTQCRIVVDLIPSCPLTNMQIAFDVAAPLCTEPQTYTFSTLCEKTVLNASLSIKDDKEVVVSSLIITAVVSYMVNDVPRVVRRRCTVSSRFVLLPCTVTDDKCSFKIDIGTNKEPAFLTSLFQEFKDDKWLESTCSDETAGFCLRYNSDKKCIVSLLKSKYGFKFTGNSIPLIHLLLSQIMSRCKNLKSAAEKNQKPLVFECKYVPRDELINAIRKHVDVRNKIRELQLFLEKLSAQYRLIQRRLLIKLKDKMSSNISALQMLYRDTYEKLIETIRSIEEKQHDLTVCSSELQSVLNLTFDLMFMNSAVSQDKGTALRNALCLTELNSDAQGWEERANANLTYLLRTTLANQTRDQHRIVPSADKIIIDSAILENLVMTAIERITGDQYVTSQKLDQTRNVSPIPEGDESNENLTTEKKLKFIKHQKLLSKRPNLEVSSNMVEQLDDSE